LNSLSPTPPVVIHYPYRAADENEGQEGEEEGEEGDAEGEDEKAGPSSAGAAEDEADQKVRAFSA
jgi:hypothetical protein